MVSGHTGVSCLCDIYCTALCERHCEGCPGDTQHFSWRTFLAGASANAAQFLVSFCLAIAWDAFSFSVFPPSSTLDLLMALWLFRAISPLARFLRIFSVRQLSPFCSLPRPSGLHNRRWKQAGSGKTEKGPWSASSLCGLFWELLSPGRMMPKTPVLSWPKYLFVGGVVFSCPVVNCKWGHLESSLWGILSEDVGSIQIDKAKPVS